MPNTPGSVSRSSRVPPPCGAGLPRPMVRGSPTYPRGSALYAPGGSTSSGSYSSAWSSGPSRLSSSTRSSCPNIESLKWSTAGSGVLVRIMWRTTSTEADHGCAVAKGWADPAAPCEALLSYLCSAPLTICSWRRSLPAGPWARPGRGDSRLEGAPGTARPEAPKRSSPRISRNGPTASLARRIDPSTLPTTAGLGDALLLSTSIDSSAAPHAACASSPRARRLRSLSLCAGAPGRCSATPSRPFSISASSVRSASIFSASRSPAVASSCSLAFTLSAPRTSATAARVART